MRPDPSGGCELVIGASGQVGEHLISGLSARGRDVVSTGFLHAGPSRISLDLRDGQAVAGLFGRVAPRVVYLSAALTNVDYCELHPDESYAVNVEGAATVVREANRAGAAVVFFSTDYIFDGASGPYRETDPARPVCVYGLHKLLAEHYVAAHAARRLIVRTTGVYGWESQGKNFVVRLIDALRAGRPLKAPADQTGTPTYAPCLADAVLELVDRGASGVFHVAGSEAASRYEFARAAARAFGLDESLIQPVSTPELAQAAPRPLSGGLDISKAQALLQTELIGYREGLRRMAEEGRPSSLSRERSELLPKKEG